MNREHWLNGWVRRKSDSSILIGVGIHCVGCGKSYGIVAVSIPEDYKSLDKIPDWPFPEDDCPVCSNEYRHLTLEDIADCPLSVLREAVTIRKKRL